MAETTPPPSTDLAAAPDIARGALVAVPLNARIRYAQTIAEAGDMLPRALIDRATGRPNVGKVFLLHETGQMLGVHPVAALNGIHVIEGKPTISPALMSALVRRAGHKLRVRVTGTVEHADLTATAQLIRVDDPDWTFEATWSLQRAVRAGLCTMKQLEGGRWATWARDSKGKPLPWEKFPEAMLKARVIGEVCREGAEEALCGVHYTPEELGAEVTESGEVIEGTLVTPGQQQQTPPVDLGPLVHAAIYSARSRTSLVDAMRQLPVEGPVLVRWATVDGPNGPTRKAQWESTAQQRLNAIRVVDTDGVEQGGWDLMLAVAGTLPATDPEGPPAHDQSATAPQQQQGPEGITQAQLTAVNAAVAAMGITERDERLGVLSDWTEDQRTLSSSTELTKAEAHRFLDAMRQREQAAGGTVDAELVEDDTTAREPDGGAERREQPPRPDPARRHPAMAAVMPNVRAAAERQQAQVDAARQAAAAAQAELRGDDPYAAART